MKNFMLLFRGGADPTAMSPEDSQKLMQQWFGWVTELKEKGIYASGEALMPTPGKIVSESSVVTDGPFAESKELIGGYFIIHAEDLDAATEIAKASPDLPHGGTVEVRDVVVFDNM